MATESPTHWISSSHSGNGGGSCVQWAPATATTGVVPVRDSKDVRRPGLSVDTRAWAVFIGHLKSL
ncbi:DUF397 domain-containing protein [Streptomyces sp. XM4193]|uniref:DUF397 domain-containing protein n=1 Tax=Streptomyces sp. XM4193 TaxID=2929782 RepID=UPI001FFAF524|nr:DUF397 domain-containing protein [Streptomyces sp. XM4193]MCK1794496.1 DUF397 domain-containing protein [Streptomyces sp. XM4193]